MPMRSFLLALGCLSLACGAFGQVTGPAMEPEMVGPSAGAVANPYYGPPGYQPVPAPNGAELPQLPESWLRSAFIPAPVLTVRLQAQWLQPNYPNSSALATQFQQQENGQFIATGVPPRSEEQYILTPRAVLEYRPVEYFSIEASGWVTAGPDQSDGQNGQPDIPLFLDPTGGTDRPAALNPLPANFPTTADFMRTNWGFTAGGFEVMALQHFILPRGPIADFAIGLGGRVMWIDEDVNVHFEDRVNNISGRLGANAENNLYGAQIMARATLQSPVRWLRMYGDVKLGLMANNTENDTSILDNTGQIQRAGATHTQFAQIFECNAFVEVFVTRNVTVFGGYQLLYVERALRAADQIIPDTAQFLSGNLKNQGHLLMTGPAAGVVVTY